MTAGKIAIPILKLAIPVMFIQVCQASLGLADTFVAGRYSLLINKLYATQADIEHRHA